MTLKEFIDLELVYHKPFVYNTQVQKRQFMFSYDMDTEERKENYENNNFRLYIIAALICKGADNLDSYVSSSIFFTADVPIGTEELALKNWDSFFQIIFKAKMVTMLNISMEKSNMALTASSFKQEFKDNFIIDVNEVVSLIS